MPSPPIRPNPLRAEPALSADGVLRQLLAILIAAVGLIALGAAPGAGQGTTGQTPSADDAAIGDTAIDDTAVDDTAVDDPAVHDTAAGESSAGDDQGGPPLLAGATVVAVVGIAGDVESERAYAGWLEALLEACAVADPAPRRIYLLLDGGEDGGLVPDSLPELPIEIRTANRAGWSTLAEELGRPAAADSGSNGLVSSLSIFLWGHGGRQGKQPVFHVRGPRLTAADLSRAVGDDTRNSSWLLYFTGSGEIADRLRGEGRRILASESSQVFRSDPIGLDLLLQSLRRDPNQGLEELSRRVGPRIAAWYTDQRLARTEEPTLWRGSEPPLLLARLEPEIDPAEETLEKGLGSNSGETVVAETSESEPPSPDQPLPEPPSAELTDSPETGADPLAPAVDPEALPWPGVERVDGALFPGHAAVVLARRVETTLADNPAVVEEREEIVQILTPEGVGRGDVELSYWPPGEKLRILDAEVVQSDGRRAVLDPADIREAAANAPEGYSTPVRKIFSFPEVEPGAVIRLRVERQWRRFPLPHVPLEIEVSDDLPVRRSSITVRVPKGSPLHWDFRSAQLLAVGSGDDGSSKGGGAPDPAPGAAVAAGGWQLEAPEPVERTTPYGESRTWTFENLPAWPREVLSSGAPPALLISTFPSWSEFGDWYRRLVQLADEVTPDIALTASELTRGLESDVEKVRALYEFVTGLRYVSIPIGVNSHRPHAAADVLEHRYGDCKDKANLLNTLLGTLGIEAHLVLVPRFSQAHASVPGLAFNHAISRVRLGDEILWLDTTDEVARFGLLPPGDPGRRVLVIEEGVESLVTLPEPRLEDHHLELHTRVDLSDLQELGHGPAEARLTASGIADYLLRHGSRGLPEGLPRIEGLLEPISGAFELRSQSSTRAKDLGESFRWQAEGRVSGWISELPSGADPGSGAAADKRHLLHPGFYLPGEWQLALHARQTPLRLLQGYPLNFVQEVEVVLPAAAVDLRLPEPSQNLEGPLNWSLVWTEAPRLPSDGGPVLRIRLELMSKKGELGADETLAFQENLRRLHAALVTGALYGLHP